MMMWNSGMGWGGWLLMSVTTVAFWAVVVFGIVALFRGTRDGGTRDGGSRSARQGPDSADHILEERFARGEIDAEEFRQRKQVLHSTQ